MFHVATHHCPSICFPDCVLLIIEVHHPYVQDHFRVIVKPAYTNVYRERGGVLGVVEFDTREDLERAIRKLDDTEFKNPFDRAFIRVIDESDDRGRSRSRSPRGR